MVESCPEKRTIFGWLPEVNIEDKHFSIMLAPFDELCKPLYRP
jgi:hypothetical protein